MSEINLSQTLPEGVDSMILAGGVIALSLAIVMVIVFMKRWHGRFVPLLLGLIAYLLFVFVCPNLLISALAMVPSVDEAFTYNQTAYIVLYCILIAVASLVAKYVIGQMLLERYERKGDVYMAGFGFGLGDMLLYAMSAMSSYVWCLAIHSDGLASLFEGLTETEALATYQSVEMLLTAPAVIWLLFGLNSVMDMLVQYALTNSIYGVIKGTVPKAMYSVSAIATFASLIAFQVYDETSMTSILICFAVKAVIFTAIIYYTFHVVGGGIKYSED